jgi:N4-gp56 family major capsid protein
MATLFNTLVRTSGGDVVLDSTTDVDLATSTTQQQKYYVLTLIKRLLPYLPLWEDAQKVTIPTRSGGFGATNGVIEMRKFASLPVSTTALSEGTPPDGLNLSTSRVTVSLSQYGDWIKITDLLATASIDDVMREATDVLAENAGRKLHKVIMNALTGGDVTQQIFAGSNVDETTITAADVLTSAAIKKAVRWLRTNNVPPYPDGYYRGILHPYQAYDLMSDSLWQDVAKYNGGSGAGGGLDLIAGEIGKMHGVRFRESTEILVDTAGASSAATYSSFVYGPNAFGVFDFKTQAVNNINSESGRGMTIHTVPVNSPTKDDPLGQFGLVGWKAAFAAKVVDALRIVRIRTGATQ